MEDDNGIDGIGAEINTGIEGKPKRGPGGKFLPRTGSTGSGSGSGSDDTGITDGSNGTESGSDRGDGSTAGRKDGNDRGSEGTGKRSGFFKNGNPKKNARAETGARVSVKPKSLHFDDFNDEETKPQIKREKSGSKLVNAKPGDSMLENITVLLISGFGMLASVKGSHWNIDLDESESLSRPLTNILMNLPSSASKRAHKLMTTVAAPIALFGAASTIVISRMKMDSMIQNQVNQQVETRMNAEREKNAGINATQAQNVSFTSQAESGTGQGTTTAAENVVRDETGISAIYGDGSAVYAGGR